MRDQIHNEENLSLPALWLKRQEETKEAFGRSTEEIEMLRDRLRDQEKDRLEEQKPIFVEIALLRDAQQSHDMTVQSRDKLWAEERQRLREEVDLTEQRVKKAEEKYAMKMEVIGGPASLGVRLRSILEPRWRPRAPRGAPRGAKMANLALRWTNLAPKWGLIGVRF